MIDTALDVRSVNHGNRIDDRHAKSRGGGCCSASGLTAAGGVLLLFFPFFLTVWIY